MLIPKCDQRQYNNDSHLCIPKLTLAPVILRAGRVLILLVFTGLLTEARWSQAELSNQISGLQYGFKGMRLIGFPDWTLVITSTMSMSLNMSMFQLGPQYLRNALARESNHCLFIIIILFLSDPTARQPLCTILRRASLCCSLCRSVYCLVLQNNFTSLLFSQRP